MELVGWVWHGTEMNWLDFCDFLTDVDHFPLFPHWEIETDVFLTTYKITFYKLRDCPIHTPCLWFYIETISVDICSNTNQVLVHLGRRAISLEGRAWAWHSLEDNDFVAVSQMHRTSHRLPWLRWRHSSSSSLSTLSFSCCCSRQHTTSTCRHLSRCVLGVRHNALFFLFLINSSLILNRRRKWNNEFRRKWDIRSVRYCAARCRSVIGRVKPGFHSNAIACVACVP